MLKVPDNKLCVLDIFSGAGGLSLGLKLSGFFEPVASVEYNKDAAMTYKTNFPIAHVFQKRVEEVTGKDVLNAIRFNGYKKIDVICGGPPCRPFSSANMGNTRWSVMKKIKKIQYHPDWMDYLRLIRDLDPICVIAENVMGFRTDEDVYAMFVRELESLGYTVSPKLLDASKFGIPQTRKRIIIMAVKGSLDRKKLEPIPTVVDPNTVEDAIMDLPSISNNNPGVLISKYSDKPISEYAKQLRGKQAVLFDHVTHQVHPVMQKRFKYIPQGYNLKKAWQEKIMPAEILYATYVHRGKIRRYKSDALKTIHGNIYRRLQWKKPSPTITHPRKTVLIHPSQDRLLSIREAARIQSFPDTFRFCGTENQQYQQIADAVPPLLARSVGMTIFSVIPRDLMVLKQIALRAKK